MRRTMAGDQPAFGRADGERRPGQSVGGRPGVKESRRGRIITPMAEDRPAETVYQLRVVLAEISPLIWRRLQVTGSTTLAELHQVPQVAFGWEDDYLHAFTDHGVDYGTTGGCHTSGAAVPLDGLGLRERERFGYTYNFFAGWRHDLRVEQTVPADPKRRYPRCLAGARRVPPEECDGPDAYPRLRADRPRAVLRIAEILGELIDEHPDDRLCDVPHLRDELRGLMVYGRLDDFDHTAVNQALRTLQVQRRG